MGGLAISTEQFNQLVTNTSDMFLVTVTLRDIRFSIL